MLCELQMDVGMQAADGGAVVLLECRWRVGLVGSLVGQMALGIDVEEAQRGVGCREVAGGVEASRGERW